MYFLRRKRSKRFVEEIVVGLKLCCRVMSFLVAEITFFLVANIVVDACKVV